MLPRLALLTLLALPVHAVEPLSPSTTLADFNEALPAGLETIGLRAVREVDAVIGNGVLRLTPAEVPAGTTPAVFLPLAGKIDPATTGALSFTVNGQAESGLVRLRLGACDDHGRLILQRTLLIQADATTRPVDIALADFRWGEVAAGWRDARSLRVAVETPFASIDLDDLRLVPPAVNQPVHERLARFAFPNKNVRMMRTDTMLLATDVTADGLTDADLAKILDQMRRAQTFVRRTFGEAIRPIDDPAPITLFIFREGRECTDFWRRRGAAWNVAIIPPSWGAYTVQDLATAVFDPATGADRPTFVHEAVHAIIAREVRIMPGVGTHGWIQEGLANYVQLSLHSSSIAPDAYASAFTAGVTEGAALLPLDRLMTGKVEFSHYAQIASLCAYIAEAHPQWWPTIGKGIVAGDPMVKVLEACGTDFARLQADWLAWGRKRFATPRPDHFAKPVEWAE